jgi:ribosome-associated translation inhibitor RaiA
MQIQINTDSSIEGHARLADHLREEVESGLDRFAHRLSRVEVHLTDVNQAKGGPDDKRCVLEARIQGQNPQAVTHHADTPHTALKGAVDKMVRLLDSTFGRLHSHR